MPEYKNPIPTVDVIVETTDDRGRPGIVLVHRGEFPIGWALPGGHVEEGEPLGAAAIREIKEETGLDVELVEQFFTYSDPKRDPRKHRISTIYIGRAKGTPKGGDDADDAKVFGLDELPGEMCFDHGEILRDYVKYARTGERRKL